jgi:hypothetical protein
MAQVGAEIANARARLYKHQPRDACVLVQITDEPGRRWRMLPVMLVRRLFVRK